MFNKTNKFMGLTVGVLLLGSNFQIGETLYSPVEAAEQLYVASSEELMYEQADKSAAAKTPDITPQIVAAFRIKETGKNGIHLDPATAGGDPIKRSVPAAALKALDKKDKGQAMSQAEANLLCWGRDGFTSLIEAKYHAISQYQIDIIAHCSWYRENFDVLMGITSSDTAIKQRAINLFAEKSASLLQGNYMTLKSSGLFSTEESLIKALAASYNQGVGTTINRVKGGSEIGAGTTPDAQGRNYVVGWWEIYQEQLGK